MVSTNTAVPNEPLENPRPPHFTLRSLLAIVAVIALLLGLAIPALRSARDSSRRMQCANNLKNIALGLHNYLDGHRVFPAAHMALDEQKSHNWRIGPFGFGTCGTPIA